MFAGMKLYGTKYYTAISVLDCPRTRTTFPVYMQSLVDKSLIIGARTDRDWERRERE